ncbi:MAG: hypothetical protein L0H11_09275, partial [Brevibacterium aurantiacum]|nr:hypothetical protein [Brevibacterium aurantiacum]
QAPQGQQPPVANDPRFADQRQAPAGQDPRQDPRFADNGAGREPGERLGDRPVDDGRPVADGNRPVEDDYRMGSNRPVADDRGTPRAPEGDPRAAENDPRLNDPRFSERGYDPRATEQRTFEDPDTPRH